MQSLLSFASDKKTGDNTRQTFTLIKAAKVLQIRNYRSFLHSENKKCRAYEYTQPINEIITLTVIT